MCGISGIFDLEASLGHSEIENQLERMSETLTHRGPDGSGVWVDSDSGIGLAHRRLAIIDLSPEGGQPMHSSAGRYCIAFNGEIYNFQELRRELGSDMEWRGHSDTEALLAAIEAWGLVRAVRKTVGMFAFALWDRKQRRLHLVRDRMGEKPLYYGWVGRSFVFASELKALKTIPGWVGAIDRDALTAYLRHNYIPAPYSIYSGIKKLLPGTILDIPAHGTERDDLNPVPYWRLEAIAAAGFEHPFSGSENDAIGVLEQLLFTSVKQKMVSDVPLGAFLSGGIDSSLIVALMQAQSDRPISTFTIGFNEKGYNEAQHAKIIATHLGTDHTELYVEPDQARAVIPDLPTLFDEPFSDSSQIPTLLVSQMARQEVTVSLSGDGGDELFFGYQRYFLALAIWSKLKRLPYSARRRLAGWVQSIPRSVLDSGFSWVSPIANRYGRPGKPSDKLYKLAEMMSFGRFESLYQELVSHWKHPSEIVINGNEPGGGFLRSPWSGAPNGLQQTMMYQDSTSYLPDDILVKVDRASMGVSLESRVPMLDHRVVEFAFSLPVSMKSKDGEGKWLLRQLLYKRVPRTLLDRPKMGFGVPIDTWLRGPLREWAEDLLAPARLSQEGFFEVQPIQDKWVQHIKGTANWAPYLWDILMFQAWLQEQ